ncbi:DUF4919 domain-containing protein [Chitinophaga filiformis]|uniref:DUF4919 domain-containing protein n=1 Tax=Chitinophaga filiformis TaxID=104663 RepID=UPI001F30FDB0|nr:DUF4919 domain-containing protein [Chitinophaga filiformis]MCF6407331.1 DUF4919 domain-containing protein [Chitinophaga filiformis]
MTNINKLLLIGLLFPLSAWGQDNKSETAGSRDKYSKYIKQLEGGDLNIDYTDFRNSFLDSEQFGRKRTNYYTLKQKVRSEINNSNYQEVIKLTKDLLDLDYTSMSAHSYLHHAYGMIGDTANQKKHQNIELGLIYSIIKSGDGKTCETGWHVTQIEEEYYILNIIGAQLQIQSISNSGKNACDKMIVKTSEGKTETYYFEANKVFEMEKKLFEQ